MNNMIFTRSNYTGKYRSGYQLGIILQDYRGPFVPGDVGNATSYDYPVSYDLVEGCTSARMFKGDESLTPLIISAARRLEDRGVLGITSDCGFFARYQADVARAVKVPVFLSSLIQLPFVLTLLGQDHMVAVLTANGRRLDKDLLAVCGVNQIERVAVIGLENEPVFGGTVTGGSICIDTDELREEIVRISCDATRKNSRIRAFLVECSMLPPYSRAIADHTNLPVFDFQTMIRCFHASWGQQRSYSS